MEIFGVFFFFGNRFVAQLLLCALEMHENTTYQKTHTACHDGTVFVAFRKSINFVAFCKFWIFFAGKIGTREPGTMRASTMHTNNSAFELLKK